MVSSWFRHNFPLRQLLRRVLLAFFVFGFLAVFTFNLVCCWFRAAFYRRDARKSKIHILPTSANDLDLPVLVWISFRAS